MMPYAKTVQASASTPRWATAAGDATTRQRSPNCGAAITATGADHAAKPRNISRVTGIARFSR